MISPESDQVKMYEELLGEEEILPGEVYEKFYIGHTLEVDCEEINNLINHFTDMENDDLKGVIMKIVYAEPQSSWKIN